MHFDINKLKGRLDFLEVLLNNTNDKYKRREILNDIKKIKYLIRYMNSSIILYSDDGCDRVLGDFKEKKDSVVASRVLDFLIHILIRCNLLWYVFIIKLNCHGK